MNTLHQRTYYFIFVLQYSLHSFNFVLEYAARSVLTLVPQCSPCSFLTAVSGTTASSGT